MRTILHWVNRALGIVGLRLSRVHSGDRDRFDIESVVGRLSRRQVSIGTVIDVGASNGSWSEKLMEHFPESNYHLIEANPVHYPALVEFVRKHANASFCQAAAADVVGEVFFDGQDPWGGLASHFATEANRGKVPSTTIDSEVSEKSLQGPFLIKLDTHGFEVPIFEGAECTLMNTSVIVVETYNFHLTEGSLTFWEMCDFLQRRGFRPADLIEPMHRPKDMLFWQVDIVFIRSDRPEFSDTRYD